jgi:hypothetical protein
MLEWLKRKATEKQRANINQTLAKLIPLSNQADATIGQVGDSTAQQNWKSTGSRIDCLSTSLAQWNWRK